MSREYLTCKETAVLVRKALKEAFPGQKFSVRIDTYSMGAHIDVRWLDGPTKGMVKAVIGHFEGSYFDGMIDYKGSIYHTLDGTPVHLGADSIDLLRDHSNPMVEWAICLVWEKYNPGFPEPSVEDFRQGRTWNQFVVQNARGELYWSVQGAVHRQLEEINWYGNAKPSPTAESLKVIGSDGYSEYCGSGISFG